MTVTAMVALGDPTDSINGSPDMVFKASAFDTETRSSPKARRSSTSPCIRDDRSNPRPRRVNRWARADAFGAFSAEIVRELNPRGPLESVLSEHVALSAWRLKGAIGREVMHLPSQGEDPDDPAEKAKRPSTSAADGAARSVREALEALDYLRDRWKGCDPTREIENSRDVRHGNIEPNEWPIVPFDESDPMPIEGPPIGDDEAPIWRDRLVFDFEISEITPVIKGTWITVSHVVSLIVDGSSWADILRSHPELSEEDIRACVAYAVDRDQDED